MRQQRIRKESEEKRKEEAILQAKRKNWTSIIELNFGRREEEELNDLLGIEDRVINVETDE